MQPAPQKHNALAPTATNARRRLAPRVTRVPGSVAACRWGRRLRHDPWVTCAAVLGDAIEMDRAVPGIRSRSHASTTQASRFAQARPERQILATDQCEAIPRAAPDRGTAHCRLGARRPGALRTRTRSPGRRDGHAHRHAPGHRYKCACPTGATLVRSACAACVQQAVTQSTQRHGHRGGSRARRCWRRCQKVIDTGDYFFNGGTDGSTTARRPA